jgi:hypothetical protein
LYGADIPENLFIKRGAECRLDESLKTISKYAIEPDNFDHLLTLASHLKIVEPIFKEWEELKFQMNK